jgi:hypothetical protein
VKHAFIFFLVVSAAGFVMAQTPAQPQATAPPAAAAAAPPAATPQQAPAAAGEIAGTVKATNAPLPGVAISATNTLTGQKVLTSTDLSGNFTIAVPSNGRWVVRAELAAFAPATREVVINAQNHSGKADMDMMLASRAAAAQQQQQQSQISQLAGAMQQRGFQSLGLNAGEGGGEAAAFPGGAQPQAVAEGAALPNPGLMGGDAATESVAVSGSMGRSQNFGNNLDEFNERFADLRDRIARGELQGFVGGGEGNRIVMAQGGGGMPGGGMMNGGGGPQIVINFGGPGGMGMGPGGMRGFNVNRPHGFLYYSNDNSLLDARSFSLSGVPAAKPDYAQHTFGANVGGILKIPHVITNMNTFYFVGYNGRHASSPFDQFATVPTAAQRNGDFSALPFPIFDPVTHQPFANNQIPRARMDSAALGVLSFIPTPNQPGATNQNFHRVTSSDARVDGINLRLVHNFGASPVQQFLGLGGPGGGGGGRGARAGGGAAGQRGGRGNRRPRSNITFGLSYNNNDNDIVNIFPSVAGKVSSRGINVPIGFTYGRGRTNNTFNVNFSRQRSQVSNLYAGITDVESGLGINGISRNPFDWGLPGISLTHYTGLGDVSPSLTRNQTLSFSDTFSFTHGKMTWRFGGDFRRIQQNTKSSQNARGRYTFTGFATAQYVNGVPVPNTGYDFADFLLGLPQQAAAQFGVNSYYFRANNWNAFVQNDWRVHSKLTLNLGLRYEYISPFQEKFGRIVNLDANPDFTAVATVQPGQAGPFTGAFPKALVNPDRNNFAPRIGIAWRPLNKTVVRAGYGINYNLGAYAQIAQLMAFQPPFAFSATNTATPASLLTLANGFPTVSGNTITNNFGVARDYALGYVQSINFDIQRELPKNLMLNIGYNGAKGTHLDMTRAPNRTPTGLRIANVQPFNWHTDEGASTMHAAELRLRKRMSHGVSLGGSYTFSKSLDNASSIGGQGGIIGAVAQNDRDLTAERSYSSFDQRHRFTADYVLELPFGQHKPWLQSGFGSHVLGGWTVSGDAQLASGQWYTPRILGNIIDVARGVNGTLRPDVTGIPLPLDHPTYNQWFDTGAFIAPPAGQFGNARRNSIQGQGLFVMGMSASKNITLRETQGLELRISALNLLNTPHFASVDTTINSPSYGRLLAPGQMRRVQLSARYRF